MFVRIVKMGFAPENIEAFLANFDANKDKIRNFEGCQFLELYRDKNNKAVNNCRQKKKEEEVRE